MRFIAEKSLSYMFNQKVWFIAEKSLYCMVYNRKVIVLYGL